MSCTKVTQPLHVDRMLCNLQRSSPHLLSNVSGSILRNYGAVATTFNRQGMVPLVHGRNMQWYIFDALQQHLGATGINRLRNFDEELCQRTSSVFEQIQQKSQTQQLATEKWKQSTWTQKAWILLKDTGRFEVSSFDHVHADSLFACTLGIAHSERLESPLSFAFGSREKSILPGYVSSDSNTSITADGKAIEQCRKTLVNAGMPRQQIHAYMRKIDPLFKEANSMPYGEIVVVGMPGRYLSRKNIAYMCYPLGIPTGQSVQEAVDVLSQGKHPPSSQLRVVMGQDLKTISSEISVVSVSDLSQITPFLAGNDTNPEYLALREALDEYTYLSRNRKNDETQLQMIQAFMQKARTLTEP